MEKSLFIYFFIPLQKPDSMVGRRKNMTVEKQDTEGKHDKTMPGILAHLFPL